MKKWLLNKRAEDILTDDSLINDLGNADLSKSGLTERESLLVNNIYQAAQEDSRKLEPHQKQHLGERIARTINTYKRNRFVFRVGTAAAVILIVGISVLIRSNRKSDLQLFADANAPVEFKGDTRLILSGEKEIKIASNESDIEYAGNGKAIKIDTIQEVSQAVPVKKPVMNTIVVPYGKRAHITLSDSSKVWLNSGTKLIYPARFAANKREVYLEGEGLFEVSHNKNRPFHVFTPNVEIKVLGTIFNVCDYTDDKIANATLESGSVELKYDGKSIWGRSKVIMEPGMLATYNPEKKTIEQTRVNTKYYTSWKDGYLYFDHEPLENILRKISRYYNEPIRLSNQQLANETFSGPLDLRRSATEVLDMIAEITNTNIENIDNQIIISKDN